MTRYEANRHLLYREIGEIVTVEIVDDKGFYIRDFATIIVDKKCSTSEAQARAALIVKLLNGYELGLQELAETAAPGLIEPVTHEGIEIEDDVRGSDHITFM